MKKDVGGDVNTTVLVQGASSVKVGSWWLPWTTTAGRSRGEEGCGDGDDAADDGRDDDVHPFTNDWRLELMDLLPVLVLTKEKKLAGCWKSKTS